MQGALAKVGLFIDFLVERFGERELGGRTPKLTDSHTRLRIISGIRKCAY
jgi:hypothetical protein